MAMFLAIDGRRVIRQPHMVEHQPEAHDTSMTADGRPLVRPSGNYTTFNLTWGRDFSYQDVLGELDRLRATRGVHAITLETIRGQRYLTLNAYMGKPRQSSQGYLACGDIFTSAFTIPFVQVDTPTFLFPLRFRLRGIIGVAAPFASHPAPAAGRIIAVDGYIADLGSGAGQTRIQISNGATNYLSTPGDFVSAPPEKRLQNQVLATVLDFAKGDSIDVDVTAIPAGGLSKDAVVIAWCWVYRP
ncbi:MAG: hypothetical protein Q8P59_06820 [Dehalococcoidia bacterium]|nr:hypothetical protein [Dehalococcoidia bacterium]